VQGSSGNYESAQCADQDVSWAVCLGRNDHINFADERLTPALYETEKSGDCICDNIPVLRKCGKEFTMGCIAETADGIQDSRSGNTMTLYGTGLSGFNEGGGSEAKQKDAKQCKEDKDICDRYWSMAELYKRHCRKWRMVEVTWTQWVDEVEDHWKPEEPILWALHNAFFSSGGTRVDANALYPTRSNATITATSEATKPQAVEKGSPNSTSSLESKNSTLSSAKSTPSSVDKPAKSASESSEEEGRDAGAEQGKAIESTNAINRDVDSTEEAPREHEHGSHVKEDLADLPHPAHDHCVPCQIRNKKTAFGLDGIRDGSGNPAASAGNASFAEHS